MELAQLTADEGLFTADALLGALDAWEETATSLEVLFFPLYVCTAQCQRLVRVLQAILYDAQERTAAARLLRHMKRHKQPALLLRNARLRTVCLAELLRLVHMDNQDHLLPVMDAWLEEQDLTETEVTQQALARQLQLAAEIQRAADCFSDISRLNWDSRCAAADALHPLLMKDPAGIYPRLNAASQINLRCQIETLSRHTRLEAYAVLQRALSLAEESEPSSPGRSIAFWFQDSEGLQRLQRSLAARKGRLYARFARKQHQLSYAFLWVFSVLTGFLFLQNHGPVWMLPFFALAAGCISRSIIRHLPQPALPQLTISDADDSLRTLVVMPAELKDPHEAIRMVRQLKTAMQAFPQEIDFMLLGDFGPCITPVSSSDQPILHAAAAAVAALEDDRVIYLHRARIWNSLRHCYSSMGGELGAVTEICRLIAQGECETPLAFSTMEAACLERRYAYVLVLPANCQPAPGMYESLMGAMAHPLVGRRPTGQGWQGYAILSPEGSKLFDGIGLIRPDAFLEATDGVLSPYKDPSVIYGELAGHASVPGAKIRTAASIIPRDDLYTESLQAWRAFPWLLPFVKTPSGLVNNPLNAKGQFHLRERLRTTLVPLAQCVLLLFSLLTRNAPLLVLALLTSFINHPSRSLADFVRNYCRLSLLPASAAVSLQPIFDLLRKKPSASSARTTLEIWAQGIAAALMIALGLALPGIAIPSWTLGVIFACFPLAHRFLDAPFTASIGLTRDHIILLERIAASTWAFFQRHASKEHSYLPPCEIQFDPAVATESVTSPEAIAASILACICAKDLGFLQPDAAARRLTGIAAALETLPMPLGLPCRRYALPALTATDERVDSHSCGILLCALMTAAQALRSWLAELPVEYTTLSSSFEQAADRIQIQRLYDPASGLIHAGLDETGQPEGYVDLFASETLLLSVASCAKRWITPEHFSHLRRTQIQHRGAALTLSYHGTAAEMLLPSLFVPMNTQEAEAFILAMKDAGQHGLWGQSECAWFTFDPALQYQREVFGLQVAAFQPNISASVYTPYAAALCLPHTPGLAADALVHFAELGALGPEGFCDAADLTHGTALVGLQDAFHQAIILIASAHLLAEAPIRRYFCSLPQVEALLPLLDAPQQPLVLPSLPVHSPLALPVPAAEHTANPLEYPAEAQVLGNAEFHLIADAAGNSLLFDGNTPLTRFSPAVPSGIQFYLVDEGSIYRLGNASASNTVTFSSGEVRFEQRCGCLRAEMVLIVDTLRKRAIHILTITNLSTRDRLIELADLLVPDLQAVAGTLEAAHPEKNRLTLHARGTETTLFHSMNTIAPPISSSVCTDLSSFLGRRGKINTPFSLEESMRDHLVSSPEPCLSFRTRVSLGGRGQFIAWFTTSLADEQAPTLSELNSLRHLAALQHAAIDNVAPLTDQQRGISQRLIMPLLIAGNRIDLHLQNTPLPDTLEDLDAILHRLTLHGTAVELYAAGSQAFEEQLRSALSHPVHLNPPEDMPAGSLQLKGDTPLSVQLDALHTRLISSADKLKPPLPALLPGKTLRHACTYGGFDPDTSDYIIQLNPYMTTPSPWLNTHTSRYFSETVDESGFRAPFQDQLQIRQTDGTLLSPWSCELPRSIRMGLSETSWEAWSDTLDVRLTASCLPGHCCGLRILRIRNASQTQQVLQIAVLSQLRSDTPCECAPGMVIEAAFDSTKCAFLAGNNWEARVVCPPLPEDVSFFSLPDSPKSHYALLQCEMQLPPHASGKIVWLAGFARHSKDVARALSDVKTQRSSDLLRSNRAAQTQKLNALTISTPEDTLDLLMNRILPAQALIAGQGLSVLAFVYLSPREAQRTLLQTARSSETPEALALLAHMMDAYVRVTGDVSVLDVQINSRNVSLYAEVAQSLLSLPLDRNGLPLVNDQPLYSFLYASAAQVLHHLREHPALQEWARKLLLAADTHLWQDGFYGVPLRLDIQNLATLALGATPRTQQALEACWTSLYDRLHGCLKTQEATDKSFLPGLPENGGMRSLDAILFLREFLRTGHHEESFELLRALNPLHHTDDAARQETFRCAPYLLHGGMWVSPGEAGHGVAQGGHEAAALLYSVILQDILGFKREGSKIRMEPRVPADWNEFALTIQEGASTWRICLEKRVKTPTIDGKEISATHFTIFDDGQIHSVRFPLT